MELQGHLGHPGGQPLAGAHVDGDPGPPPVLDPQPQGHEGLGLAVGGHALLLAVADDGGTRRSTPAVYWARTDRSTASSVVGMYTAFSSFTFSSRMCVGVHAGGRLHQGEGQHLHDVVLDDVAQGPRRLVEAAAVLDPELSATVIWTCST